MYIGIILIVTVILSVTYFSYAFFTSTSEQHGKLNVVVGTLDYKIESEELVDNSVTVSANTMKKLRIKITSLNSVNSKYELYYEGSNVTVEYLEGADASIGTINANGSKTVEIRIKNTSNTAETILFKVYGGFVDKDLVIDSGNHITLAPTCSYAVGKVWDFPYNGTNGTNGSEQTFVVPCDGTYKLEVWGAQGGNSYSCSATYNDQCSSNIGGYGGYSSGNILLNNNIVLYNYIGGKANDVTSSISGSQGGYNGGGSGKNGYSNYFGGSAGGGGATHIAFDSGLLSTLASHANDDRILIVAGGGGGASSHENRGYNGGSAGGYIGLAGNNCTKKSVSDNLSCPSFGGNNNGGTQSSGYLFGQGQDGRTGGNYSWGQPATGAGGGGYYGGFASQATDNGSAGGGGGSGYIGSSRLTNKYMYCYGCQESTAKDIYTVSTTGSSSLRDTTNCPNGYSSDAVAKCAKTGNGYARITYLGD